MKPRILTPIAASLMLCFATLTHADDSATMAQHQRDAAGDRPAAAHAAERQFDRSGPADETFRESLQTTDRTQEQAAAASDKDLGRSAAGRQYDRSGPANETFRESLETSERAQERAAEAGDQGLARRSADRAFDRSGPSDESLRESITGEQRQSDRPRSDEMSRADGIERGTATLAEASTAAGDPHPNKLPGPAASPNPGVPEGTGKGGQAAARKFDRSGPAGRDVTQGVYEPKGESKAENLGERAAERQFDRSGPANQTFRESTDTTAGAQDRAEGKDAGNLGQRAANRKFDRSGPAQDGRSVPGGPSIKLEDQQSKDGDKSRAGG